MRTIEQLLHTSAEVRNYSAYNNLPLYLKAAYDVSILRVAGVDCLLVKPKETAKLVSIRKHRQQLAKIAGLECVLHFDKISLYIKQKLIEEGIPFIIENKEVYMPFLGVVLCNKKERILPKLKNISFNTQWLLLTALYDNWRTVNVTEAARKLDVSKMTVSRCFDQIQAAEIPLICQTHRERLFSWEGNSKGLCDLIMPYLRNPVFKEYRLDEYLSGKHFLFGGMSALSRYSILNDNEFLTYAITKRQCKSLDLESLKQVPENEQPLLLLQVLHYEVQFPNKIAIDPVSAYLSLDEHDKQDPRIKIAFSRILEEYIYGSGD
jgi:ligand-binding sensor protein